MSLTTLHIKIIVYTAIPESFRAFNVDHFRHRAFTSVTSILDGDDL